MSQLKEMENDQENELKVGRWMEIINIRADINELDTQKAIQNINESKKF